MGPIAEAGFTTCAIDVRGYGGSDKPPQIEAYDLQSLVGDVAGVIQALSPDAPAVVIGHDWGAPIAWNTALIRPDLVRAVSGLSVPYVGAPPQPLALLWDKVFTQRGRFFYQVYFEREGVAELEMEADPRDTVRRLYYALSGDAPEGAWPEDKPLDATLLEGLPDPWRLPAWLTEADLDYYASEFTLSGFRGPLNRYRNSDRDFAYLRRFADRKIEQPALFIGGERDLVLSMFGAGDLLSRMQAVIPDLRGADILPGCGHWTQLERPAAVNERLIAWLKAL
jgi:pimeloyl-ACP methyl ester carboxylesterase